MTPDRIKKGDPVKVEILNEAGERLAAEEINDVHTVKEAIEKGYAKSGINADIRTLTFAVTDGSDGISHRYRINDHFNLKLIV